MSNVSTSDPRSEMSLALKAVPSCTTTRSRGAPLPPVYWYCAS
jgi:hypothetical protein